MEKEEVKKYLFWGIVTGIVILSYFLLKDFFVAILSAFVLAYIIKPIHDRLSKKIPPNIAAFITVLISIIIVSLIIGIVFTSLLNQLVRIDAQDTSQQILSYFSETKYYDIVSNNINAIIVKTGEVLIGLFSATLSRIPSLVLSIFIVFFTTYYLLIDWDRLREKIVRIIPFTNKEQIVNKIEKTAREILIGTLTIALIETVIAIIGFWILGIEFYIILGFLLGLLALIPALGPALIWVPIAIIALIAQDYFLFIGIVVLGLILSVGIDYMLRLKILGSRTNMHPVIMLFGLLGGIKLFGLMGFVIGPLILSILITIIENIPSTSTRHKHKKK